MRVGARASRKGTGERRTHHMQAAPAPVPPPLCVSDVCCCTGVLTCPAASAAATAAAYLSCAAGKLVRISKVAWQRPSMQACVLLGHKQSAVHVALVLHRRDCSKRVGKASQGRG